MDRHVSVALVAVGLLACGPRAEFGLAGPSNSPDKWTRRAVELVDPEDTRELVAGPHAVGSTLALDIDRPLGAVDFWDVRLEPPGFADLQSRIDKGKVMRVEITFDKPGKADLVVEDFDSEVGRLTLEAAAATDVVLVSVDDLVAPLQDSEVVDQDDLLRTAVDFEAPLAALWLDRNGRLLTGEGLSEVELIDETNLASLSDAGRFKVRGLDTVLLKARRASVLGDPQLVVSAVTGDVTKAWQVRIEGNESVATMDLNLVQDFGLFRRVGYLRARAFDDEGRRLLGPTFTWQDLDRTLNGVGPWVELEDGCSTEVTACAQAAPVCSSMLVDAVPYRVGSSSGFLPSCRQAPAGPVALGLLALGGLFGIRRRQTP